MMLSDIGPGALSGITLVMGLLVYLLPILLFFWLMSLLSTQVILQKKILTKLEEIESRLPRQEEQQK